MRLRIRCVFDVGKTRALGRGSIGLVFDMGRDQPGEPTSCAHSREVGQQGLSNIVLV